VNGVKWTIAILLCAVFCQVFLLAEDADTFQPGTIVPQVACAADKTQTYALYLPSNFSPARVWPIIYVFDPGARGQSAVETVRAAAEKFGYIVAASNNSRNGIGNVSAQAATAIWNDTTHRFPLDDRRRYFAGMSGGARVAVSIALSCGQCAAGVIANAAGFPISAPPPHDLKFAYFAAVGNADFNFAEFAQLRRQLDQTNARYRIRIFQGTHGWAPPETWLEALNWMDLQAMSAGILPRDAKRIQPALADELALASRDESDHRILDAYREYQFIARDFVGLADVAQASEAVARLKSSKALKSAEKEEESDVAEQANLSATPSAQILAAASGDLSVPDLLELKREVGSLLNRAESFSDQNSRQALVARRTVGSLLVEAYESGDNALALKNYSAALACFDVAGAGSRNSAWAHYQRARVFARMSDRKGVFAELKLAGAQGFHDAAALDSADFQAFRAQPEYQKLIADWKARANEP
jgi:predicted esterase